MPGRGMAAGALPLFRHNSSPLCPCVRRVQPVCSAVIHLNAPQRFSLQSRSFPVNPRTVRQRINERNEMETMKNGMSEGKKLRMAGDLLWFASASMAAGLLAAIAVGALAVLLAQPARAAEAAGFTRP